MLQAGRPDGDTFTMSTPLTIAWMTSRKDACWEWFCDSLHRECSGIYDELRVICVDYWANPFGGTPENHEDRRAYFLNGLRSPGELSKWVSPKPTPWQGKLRQTKEDWFAAASARNTAIALCDTEWIAFVDDLSVFMPGWLTEAIAATQFSRAVTCGSYRKVKDMFVINGEVTEWKPNLNENGTDVGLDNRRKSFGEGREKADWVGSGSYLFGCSVVAPVEAFLDVNGWDERCDGLGFEDACTGVNLQRRGWKFRYAPGLLTYESEEKHHTEGQFKRSDYHFGPDKQPVEGGNGRDDKSHAILKLCQTGNGISPITFGNGNLRFLKGQIAAGAGFPAPPKDVREWYTSRLLREL
jgi:hypothetical protein